MTQSFRKYLGIDLFTTNRLVFNAILYSSYGVLFLVSYGFAVRMTPGSTDTAVRDIGIILFIISWKFLIFNFFNFKRISVRRLTGYHYGKLLFMNCVASAGLLLMRPVVSFLATIPFRILVLDGIATLMLIYATFILLHIISSASAERVIKRGGQRTLIVGAGATGELVLRSLRFSRNGDVNDVVGFVDDDRKKIGKRLDGVMIHGPIEDIAEIRERIDADTVIIALSDSGSQKIKRIVSLLSSLVIQSRLSITVVPSYDDLIDNRIAVDTVTNLSIDDLLARGRIDPATILSEHVAG